MKRILIKKDIDALRYDTNNVRSYAHSLEKILNELRPFDVPIPEGEEMSTFCHNPEKYVREKIEEELAEQDKTTLGKRKRDVSKLFDTLSLPSFDALNKCSEEMKKLDSWLLSKVDIEEINDGSISVTIDDNYLVHLDEVHSKYAESEDEILLYNKIKAIKDAIDDFEEQYLPNHKENITKHHWREKTNLLYFTQIEDRYFTQKHRSKI